jgi:hypothetical protein
MPAQPLSGSEFALDPGEASLCSRRQDHVMLKCFGVQEGCERLCASLTGRQRSEVSRGRESRRLRIFCFTALPQDCLELASQLSMPDAPLALDYLVGDGTKVAR